MGSVNVCVHVLRHSLLLMSSRVTFARPYCLGFVVFNCPPEQFHPVTRAFINTIETPGWSPGCFVPTLV